VRVQAYYRRADAKLALGRFSQALKDFKLAAKVAPHDPDLKRKLAECEKESQRLRFARALRTGTPPFESAAARSSESSACTNTADVLSGPCPVC
jgi:tetratricopeptide (TPR) repeat protein